MQIPPQLIELLKNPIFAGGLPLMLIGAVGALLRSVPMAIINFIWKYIVTEIDITNQDRGYKWVEHWFSNHAFAKKWIKSVSFTTEFNANGEPIVILSPAPGFHFMFHNRKLFWIYKARKDSQGMQPAYGSKSPPFMETIRICTFGGNRNFIQELLMSAYKVAAVTEEVGVKVYNYNGWWKLCDTKPYKAAESLILDNNILQDAFEDSETFLASRDWYNYMSIPWRRGYLLYGSPGSGKSSLVLTLASHLKVPVYVINLADPEMTDSRLTEALSGNEEKMSILLLEEIDCIFEQREKADENAKDAVTFAGLLNALDGLTAPEGRILIMTTNHFDKLDPALIRPGRADKHYFIDNASSVQLEQMARRFYPDITNEQVARLLSKFPDKTISMAAMQEYCLRYRSSIEDLLESSEGMRSTTVAEKVPKKKPARKAPRIPPLIAK
jgi:chaperone BCS1